MATVQRQGREVGHVHLAPRLRMSAAKHILPLYAFITYMEKCLPFWLETAMTTLNTQSGEREGVGLNQDQCR